MKLLNIDWAQFLSSLEMYRKLPDAGRRMFIEHVKPSQAVSKKFLGSWCTPFVDSGLMVLGLTEVNAQVKPEHREFSRAIRAMSRAKIFSAPSRHSFLDYLNDNLTGSETASLDGAYYYGRMGHTDLERMYSTVCSANWIKSFLGAKGPDWERDYADPAQPRYFSSPEVFKAAQRLVAAVSAGDGGPLPLDGLPELCDNILPDVFSAAMRGILRYLLLFTAIRADDLEPVAGLWPGIADRISNKPLPPPKPVNVNEPFLSTFLMDDMTAILAACAAEPLRVRSGDMQIFEADYKSLAAGLGSVPEWLEQAFHTDAEYRIRMAVETLAGLGFMERAGRPGSAYRFVVTEQGAPWLAAEPKERLRFLLDEMRNPAQKLAILPGFSSYGSHTGRKKIVPTILKTYASLPAGEFFRLGEFLTYQARSVEDLSDMMSGERNYTFNSRWGSAPVDDEVEVAWQNLLSGFLKYRLVPLGGVQLGVEHGSNLICFAMTETGRYLLGAAQDFELPAGQDARILIQPNFDVVFLAPSARLEAELARFSERKGRHVGTLFRITKTSILAAAAAGMKVEQVLDVLREHSPAEIPSNVASEIAGWFRRFREVSMRQAVIVHCPDEQTATTFMAAMGKNVTRLTPTALELHDTKIQPAVAKKLREAGIFVRSR